MDWSGMTNAEKAHMQSLMEKKQMQDFMRLYSRLVDRCFNDCINDFTSKALGSKEQSCLSKCTEKFMKHSERVGLRFGELNQMMQQQQQ
ncbi:Tim10/DDP family zinc finger-domain-containing protein [Polychytrium aggregatum]|uniref:Tim10/DDP family zinc finger-domain-containing protein n=1 Tax=Polychytrium aggregatum TaxID=110093 RepID=UPI0022FE7AD7|nr:Tim10/DDP family zinc finger-domain-containing protein [Polychytrium aggregatum]KAI9208129.1 Tim10/DDP family zinc finger-domain-containing protein [Polychytrium aggregatum]